MSREETDWGCFVVTIGYVAALILAAIMKGWALSVMWGWFIVPLFKLPAMSIPQAIGIGMIVSYLTNQSQSKEDVQDKSFTELIGRLLGYTILVPALSVGFAWIVLQFI